MHIAQKLIKRRGIIALYDISVVTLSLPLAALLRSNSSGASLDASIWQGTTCLFLVATLFYWLLGLHRGLWRYASSANLLYVARWATLAILTTLLLMFWYDRLASVGRSVIVIQWAIAILGLWVARIVYVSWFRPDDVNLGRLDLRHSTPVLLVGSGEGAALTIQMMAQGLLPGHHAVGILDDKAPLLGRTLYGVPVLGTLDHVQAARHRLTVQGIEAPSLLITRLRDEVGHERVESVARAARQDGIEVAWLPELLVSELGGRRQATRQRSARPATEAAAYETLQRGFDILIAGMLALVTAPLFILISIAVRGQIHRDIIFNQVRPGAEQRLIWVHKFSTMRDATDAQGRPLSDAERTPWVGALLRRSRFDELPQLWNIVKGDMSLIGPRPLLPRDLPEASQEQLDLRYSVRPGITGWAQVNGGNHLSSQQKLALDLWYIQHRNFVLDLRILVMTVRMVLLGERVNVHAVQVAERAFRISGDRPLAA